MLNADEKKLCLQIAREAIATNLGMCDNITPLPNHPIFQKKFGLFVSLHMDDELKGCIGYIKPYKDLYHSLVEMAQAAAFHDTRFSSVTAEELSKINIEISILSPLYQIKNFDEIEIGRDGLYLTHPHGSGLLLPQVATQYGWDVPTFLRQTCGKAGLPDSYLKDKKTVIYRFEAEVFGEE